eukprot:SAG22_NODE_398_length_11106_cov_67.829836_5_plen_74_part_00
MVWLPGCAQFDAVGASVGVDIGWCWVGRLGHPSRYSLGLLGGPAEQAAELMGYPEAAGGARWRRAPPSSWLLH